VLDVFIRLVGLGQFRQDRLRIPKVKRSNILGGFHPEKQSNIGAEQVVAG
jgi:hypothetical protein